MFKTVKEKALEFLNCDEWKISKANKVKMEKALILLLKEQDRDTRHACADAVLSVAEVCETPTGGSAISPDDAHSACMNVRVV